MFLKIREMREKALKELEHIPKGPLPQGELRAIYWAKRMHSLSEKNPIKQTAKEVLHECINFLKKDYPDFEFKYDEEFFTQ